jgi:caa(3)-type oxidase subunit IV
MADSPEEIQKSIKKYLVIGATLIVFTFITVWLSYVELPTHSLNIIVGMIVAAGKASLVALFFMHLKHESSIIYKVLFFTGILALVLFVLTFLSEGDPLIFRGFYDKFD